MTWNYTEAGHGKGPMDGVGGTLKRMCDRKVAYGMDIMSSKDFINALKDCNIFLVEVVSEDIKKMKNELSQLTIDPIIGIMKVHQFTFSSNGMYDARELTCFKCSPRQVCHHYTLPGVVQTPSNKNQQNVPTKPSGSLKTSNKTKLDVDEVFSETSSDDEEHCRKENREKPVHLQEFIDSIKNEHIDFANLLPGDLCPR